MVGSKGHITDLGTEPGIGNSWVVGLGRASQVSCPYIPRVQSPNSPAQRILHHKQIQVKLDS